MSDPLSGVSVFVQAAEAGGFSAAATKLNLTRSAVGKTVARLEARLGARLFHRTTRNQSLTEDGQAFYERCLRAIQEIRIGEAAVESGRSDAAGRLKVSMPVLFGRRCVAPILIQLARKHPKLELDLNFDDRPVNLVEEGFDLAIRLAPPGNAAGLTGRCVARQRRAVCASPEYLARNGIPQIIDDLHEHDAVAYGRDGIAWTWRLPDHAGQPIDFEPRTRFRFNDLEAVSDAATAGLGLAWLPSWLIHDRLMSGDLVEVLDDVPRLSFDTHAIWPHTPHLPVRTRCAIDALALALPAICDPSGD